MIPAPIPMSRNDVEFEVSTTRALEDAYA